MVDIHDGTEPIGPLHLLMVGKDAIGHAGWGYVDGAGAWAIQPAYDSAGPFSGGVAVVGSYRRGLKRT